MSRVLLLSSNTMTEPYHVYPVGMAVVASALSAAGHSIDQLDLLAENGSRDRVRDAILEFRPDFVGLSMRNIDTVDSFTSEQSWALASDKALVRTIREVTDAPVVVGGPAFSIMPEEILEYVGADYGIVGDGGRSFNEMIAACEQGQQIPSVLGEKGGRAAGDISVSPLWDDTIMDYYGRHNSMIGLRTKCGCPYACTYCTYPAVEGSGYRAREAGAVIEDILRLQRSYSINSIFFTDSVFNDAEGLYLEIVEEILRREIHIQWSAFFRPAGMEVKSMRLLKRSGLFAAEAGTDAASDITLEGLNKKFCFDDVVRFNEACLVGEIPCVHYVVFGGPDETEKSITEGLNNMEFLKNCVVLAFSGIRIYPGTPLHERAVEDGIVRVRDSLLRPVFYFSPHIDAGTMNRTIENAFRHHRLRIFPPSAGEERRKAMSRFGYRGPLWPLMISFKRPVRETERR